ncbi:MAG TPA: DUF2252 family protein [Gaiellaceae bacterium]
MNAVEATAAYELWLRTQLGVVLDDDLALKHERMAESASRFLRGTYYLWLSRVQRKTPPELLQAPELLTVGDLHVENFGCWRDIEGRLAWGVNDLDELATLPYTYDLLRLCASALIAVHEQRLPLHEHEVCAVVLDGYRHSFEHGGEPFVAAERHAWLAALETAAASGAAAYWAQLNALPELAAPLPAEAQTLLRAHAPGGDWQPALHRRTAGMGSLGHRRAVAVGAWQGGLAARELKELAPPASNIVLGRDESPARPQAGPSWAPDPFVAVAGAWQCRRLAPDCVRLDLVDYAHGADRHLLRAMGFETANVHQRSSPDAVARVRAHAAQLTAERLQAAVEPLVAAVEHDWHDWAATLQGHG